MNDGGPAFPVASVCNANGDVQYGVDGMSLRDYFAGQAIIGIIQDFATLEKAHNVSGQDAATIAAIASYEVADAMLLAREKK